MFIIGEEVLFDGYGGIGRIRAVLEFTVLIELEDEVHERKFNEVYPLNDPEE